MQMVYRLDTHVHTSEVSGCGKVSGADGAHLHKAAGYDGIAITDHYYEGFFRRKPGAGWDEQMADFLSGFRAAKRAGEAVGLDVFLGIELRFLAEGGEDYLVYGFDEAFLYAHSRLDRMDLAFFGQMAKDSGIVIFQAHPFRAGQRVAHLAHPGFLDGIEVFNGNPRQNSNNEIAHAFAASNALLELSGSDFHEFEDLARGGVLLARRPLDEADLARAFVDGTVTALLPQEMRRHCRSFWG